MGAHIEWHCQHCGTMRIGRQFHVWGDPYEFACTVVKSAHAHSIEFVGGISENFCNILAERDAVKRELEKASIRFVHWTRIKKGEKTKISIKL